MACNDYLCYTRLGVSDAKHVDYVDRFADILIQRQDNHIILNKYLCTIVIAGK